MFMSKNIKVSYGKLTLDRYLNVFDRKLSVKDKNLKVLGQKSTLLIEI